MMDSLLNGANDLAAQYGVNPFVFAVIYIGAIPLFIASIAWLVRNARTGKSTVLPALCAGTCFISAYAYAAIFGRNIPVWVWVFLGALIAYGIWSTVRDVRRKIAAKDLSTED
jgi:CHASE2 domain-containing sensor protein